MKYTYSIHIVIIAAIYSRKITFKNVKWDNFYEAHFHTFVFKTDFLKVQSLYIVSS